MTLVCAEAGDWPAFVNASPLLVKALGDAPLCDVWNEYKKGCAQLWLDVEDGAIKAACVTLAMADRSLDFWLCAGSARDWRALGDEIANAARGHFERMTITGRPGWGRVLGFTRDDSGDFERRL